MSDKQPVNHYVDGRDAWRIGVHGFFTKAKVICISGLITILSMGSPWWWPDNIPGKKEINLKWAAFVLFFMIGGGVVSLLYYLRNRAIRSLNIKYYLHQIAHDLRQRQTELHEKLHPGKKYSKGKLRKELEILLKEVCENIASQFRTITNDNSIAVAIRLAVYDDKKNEIFYKTFARSNGLNSQRKKTSQKISIKEGIARFLRDEKKAQGVLIYNNLHEAATVGTYKITENDQKYKDDISTMMVAPLNAWAGTKEDMIGILYITSRNKKVFNAVHVDQIAFSADLTALAVASAMELVRLKCFGDNSKRKRSYAKAL